MANKTMKIATYPDGARFEIYKPYKSTMWDYAPDGRAASTLKYAIRCAEEAGAIVTTEPNPHYSPPAPPRQPDALGVFRGWLL